MGWRHQAGIGRNNFDFIRFVLAVAVILSHSYALVQGRSTEPLLDVTRGQINLGDVAVDWFFVISGFLIVHSWLRSASTLDYMKKRVLRIYPGFITSVLLCAFIVIPIASPVVRHHFFSSLRPLHLAGQMAALRFDTRVSFTALGTTFPSNLSHGINGSLWSISYEFWCYIGVAMLGLMALLKKPKAIAILFAFVMAISLAFVIFGRHPGGGRVFHTVFGSPIDWARLLPYYMAGTLFYTFRNQIPFSRLLAGVSVILIVAAAFIPPWGMTLVLPIAGTYLLFWFAFEPKIRLENWARHGDFSYGIYVFAYPIQQLIIMKLGTQISPLLLFAVATPATILAGALSWHLIERRFLKLKKKPLIASPAHRAPAAQAPLLNANA